MVNELLNHEMRNGSRLFITLHETTSVHVLHNHTCKLENARILKFWTDEIHFSLYFEYQNYEFNIDRHQGRYSFYVKPRTCPDNILYEVIEHFHQILEFKRIAFYGGSFDPVHKGHLQIARKLIELFVFDELYFVPAFRAPHKKDKQVSSALCRYAMLTLATMNDPQLKISTIELNAPEKPYTIETLTNLKTHYDKSARIFFVMGADSWNEIDTWHEWQKLLLMTNFVVVTRPNIEITTTHIPDEIAERVVDVRGLPAEEILEKLRCEGIFFTDAVQLDISATKIRQEISLQNYDGWSKLVPIFVEDYIKKYRLYQ